MFCNRKTAFLAATRSAVKKKKTLKGVYIMTKYFATIGLMMLIGNEIFSLALLLVISLFFWMDVYKARHS